MKFFQSEQISFSTPNVKDAEEGIAIVSGAKRGRQGSSCRESPRRIPDHTSMEEGACAPALGAGAPNSNPGADHSSFFACSKIRWFSVCRREVYAIRDAV
jgi:hypothetical protein